MKGLLALATGALLALPAFAQPAAGDCARARDPARCEARQAALKACGEKRGIERRACLEASMPPADCSKSRDSARCEAIQKAKALCQGKTGTAFKKCLRDEQPTKQRKPRRSTA